MVIRCPSCDNKLRDSTSCPECGHELINEPLLGYLIAEIYCQARFALIAYHELIKSLQSNMEVLPFFHSHAFLVHASNVSKVLWNKRSWIPGRCERLRQELSIHGLHSIQEKELRNSLEHFDERLEEWSLSYKGCASSDMIVAPVGTFSGPHGEKIVIRQLDPNTMKYYFRDNEYDLRTIKGELEIIIKGVKAWSSSHPPWDVLIPLYDRDENREC